MYGMICHGGTVGATPEPGRSLRRGLISPNPLESNGCRSRLFLFCCHSLNLAGRSSRDTTLLSVHYCM